MSSMSKFKKLAGISAFAFAAMTMANSVNAANWRYAHEEYEGDVQDVFAYKFKEYIEENSDHTLQVYRFGELGESDDIMEQTQAGILNFVNQSPEEGGSACAGEAALNLRTALFAREFSVALVLFLKMLS